jgi:hypothetical protein
MRRKLPESVGNPDNQSRFPRGVSNPRQAGSKAATANIGQKELGGVRVLVERHRRLRGELSGAGSLPPGSHGEKAPYWILGITRRYRTARVPGSAFTADLPAPFRTIHTYTYGADGRINPVPTTRQG